MAAAVRDISPGHISTAQVPFITHNSECIKYMEDIFTDN